MSISEFLITLAIISTIIALAACFELALPMFVRTPANRGRNAANLGLTALTFGTNGALSTAAAAIALALSPGEPGFMARLGVPIAVQIVASVVVLDFFFGYLAHRTMHMSPTLWRAHRVHHSDPFVDVTTTYRTHPLEVAWRFLFLILPIWVLGVPAEAVAIHRLLSAVNGIFEHANLRLFWQPLDRALSLVWVTPHMHKVHHSRESVETDFNYGNILSIHDRILRTFTPTDRAFSVTYGLDEVDPTRARSRPALLAMPFQAFSVRPKRSTPVHELGFETAATRPPQPERDRASFDEKHAQTGPLVTARSGRPA